MTDRELLELAAKAAGLEWIGHGIKIQTDFGYRWWNPLADDGDALRLAVKLKIQITPGTYNKDEFSAFHAGCGEAHEFCSALQDANAATRRAIVRAAAAMEA